MLLHLPVNWTGICIAFLTPQVRNIVPSNQTLTTPLAAYTQSGRVPIPTGWARITAGIRYGRRRSCFINQLLPQTLETSQMMLERVAKSFVALQDELDSPGCGGFTE